MRSHLTLNLSLVSPVLQTLMTPSPAPMARVLGSIGLLSTA